MAVQSGGVTARKIVCADRRIGRYDAAISQARFEQKENNLCFETKYQDKRKMDF